MRISSKFIVWSWVLLLSILIGLILIAYTRLNPKSLVSLLNDQATRNYPGSELLVEKVDYGVALDFSLQLQGISLKRKDKILMHAKEIHLKVPLWLVLFNRGNAQVNVKNLDLYITDDSTEISKSKINENQLKKIEIGIPKYLVDAKYTLRAENISIRDLETSRNYLTLSKLLVREFQYGRNSAFEMTIPISISHRDKKLVSELWLFGDLTHEPEMWNLNYRGEFKTRDLTDSFQFQDLVIDGKSSFNPAVVDFQSELALSFERKNIGSGKMTGTAKEARLHLTFSGLPLSYLSLIDEEIKNPFLSKLEGLATGELKFNRALDGTRTTQFQTKLTFPGKFVFGEASSIDGQWQLNFNNDKLESSFITAKGDVHFTRRTLLDFNQKRITQFSQELGFSGIDLSLALQAVETLGNYTKPENPTYHSSVVSVSKAVYGERIFNGTFRYGVSPYEKFYQAELGDGQSAVKINFLSKPPQSNLSILFKKFTLEPSFLFLMPYLSAKSGTLDGKIEGSWSESWLTGKWLLNLKGSNLQELQGSLSLLQQNLWSNFELDPGLFKDQSWLANVSDRVLRITSFTLENSSPARLSGQLMADEKGKSHLTLTYPKNKKWRPVKKEVTEASWRKDIQ